MERPIGIIVTAALVVALGSLPVTVAAWRLAPEVAARDAQRTTPRATGQQKREATAPVRPPKKVAPVRR